MYTPSTNLQHLENSVGELAKCAEMPTSEPMTPAWAIWINEMAPDQIKSQQNTIKVHNSLFYYNINNR